MVAQVRSTYVGRSQRHQLMRKLSLPHTARRQRYVRSFQFGGLTEEIVRIIALIMIVRSPRLVLGILRAFLSADDCLTLVAHVRSHIDPWASWKDLSPWLRAGLW